MQKVTFFVQIQRMDILKNCKSREFPDLLGWCGWQLIIFISNSFGVLISIGGHKIFFPIEGMFKRFQWRNISICFIILFMQSFLIICKFFFRILFKSQIFLKNSIYIAMVQVKNYIKSCKGYCAHGVAYCHMDVVVWTFY